MGGGLQTHPPPFRYFTSIFSIFRPGRQGAHFVARADLQFPPVLPPRLPRVVACDAPPGNLSFFQQQKSLSGRGGVHLMERGRLINEEQTSGPPDWTSHEHAGRVDPECPPRGSLARRSAVRLEWAPGPPSLPQASGGRRRGLEPARAPPSSPRPSPAPPLAVRRAPAASPAQ